MTPVACPRLFEVEALRDGRLVGAELKSFERHLATCGDCAREAALCERLAQALRANALGSADELRVRRERTRLLSAFDRSLTMGHARFGAGHALVALGAVAALLSLWLAFGFGESPSVPEATPSAVVIRADGEARWSRQPAGARDLVVLERGELWIHVDHTAQGPALLVRLPDGELEDTGTTFSVSVEAGRTRRVAVAEGSVRLRLVGQAPLVLGAGQSWSAPPPPRKQSAPQPAASIPAPASVPTAAKRELSPRLASAPSAEPAASAANPLEPTAPEAPDARRGASADFRTAMRELDTGRSKQAATSFQRFLERHPADPRAQDAAYMRVLALRAAGEQASMRAAAQEYLRRYPAGFRRAEVEKLLH